MADFASATPFEPQKSDYLHDQKEMPGAPKSSRLIRLRRFEFVALSVLLTIGFVALEFQTAAAWDGRREFEVPVTIPFAAIAAVCLAGMLMRGHLIALATGLGLLVVALALTALNIWRGQLVDGSDALRNALTIATTVFMALAVIGLIAGFLWSELNDPIEAPVPDA